MPRRKKRTEEIVSKIPKQLVPKTKNQAILLDEIRKNLIVFAIGPAGSGKSHISVGSAIEHVYNKWVEKIIITRPVVESGENLGFLPGSFQDKISPYLRPVLDEKNEFWSDKSHVQPEIEIVPFAYMRGRTFKNTFIIADELQNATEDQIKMLLTRFGEGSKMVITGDLTQSDLPPRQRGGLERIINKLYNVDLVSIVKLGREDIVRHELVGRILERLDDQD